MGWDQVHHISEACKQWLQKTRKGLRRLICDWSTLVTCSKYGEHDATKTSRAVLMREYSQWVLWEWGIHLPVTSVF